MKVWDMSQQVAGKEKYVVFIPCYNASATIKETIESVREAIIYTSLEISVFIYDDYSTDDSRTICSDAIKDYTGFSLIKNPGNVGERKTTNRAFKDFYGKYDWAFIIHADDIVKKDWLKTLIDNIEKKDDPICFTVWSSYDALYDKTKEVEEGDNSGAILYKGCTLDEVRGIIRKMYSSWHISGAAFNIGLYDKLNGFEDSLAQFGDTDFFARGLLAGYTHIYISRTLTYYRIVQGSVSSVSVNTNRDINEIRFLINKHRNILTKQDVSALYGMVRRLSFRRIIKSLIQRDFTMALQNFKQYKRTIFK
jgi:glycosyltransferase involved in cell wall biosynthesis